MFLDKTRQVAFLDLWTLPNTDFGWYRPWSRELHFWVLQRVFGLSEFAFRATSMLLWVVALSLFADVVRRLSSSRAAWIATLGAASLALWGTPLLWVSGSQDLWMLCFVMASTLLFISSRMGWALLPFALALLSKETAAVLPALLVAYGVLVKRQRFADALRVTAPFWALTVAWLIVHPTLHSRLLETTAVEPGLERHPTALAALAKTLLSTLNLHVLPHPQELSVGFVARVLVSGAILAAGVIAARGLPAGESPAITDQQRPHLGRFAVAWAAIGWLPLFLPSIGWRAYYGCLGTLGAWLGLALWLDSKRTIAVAAVICLALLRGAQANTLSITDWGNESYLRRAGSILSAIRDELYRQHPTLPHHTRVYFAHIPNNIGLIAGQSPALRVWYRDSTLQAGFYSYYRPRSASSPAGEDLFFRFDSAAGMVEVKAGAEDVRLGVLQDLDWEKDHEGLARLFLDSGDTRRAAYEFEKVSMLRHRPDAAVYAGVCWESAGDTTRADSLIAAGAARMHLTSAVVRNWAARLRATMPGASEPGLSDSRAGPAPP